MHPNSPARVYERRCSGADSGTGPWIRCWTRAIASPALNRICSASIKPTPRNSNSAFVADSKTVPGQDLLNIVEYTTRTHTDGRVFTFLAKGKDSHRVLRLQFKTAFRQSTTARSVWS